jgi:hypothetical protein
MSAYQKKQVIKHLIPTITQAKIPIPFGLGFKVNDMDFEIVRNIAWQQTNSITDFGSHVESSC